MGRKNWSRHFYLVHQLNVKFACRCITSTGRTQVSDVLYKEKLWHEHTNQTMQ